MQGWGNGVGKYRGQFRSTGGTTVEMEQGLAFSPALSPRWPFSPRSCPNNNGGYSVLSACCMLGIMLSTAQTLSHLIIMYLYEVENLIPIVAIRKLKLRQAKSLALELVSGQVLIIKPLLSLIFHTWPLFPYRKKTWRFDETCVCVCGFSTYKYCIWPL